MSKLKIPLSFLIIIASVYLLSACSGNNADTILEQALNEKILEENVVEVGEEERRDEAESEESLGKVIADENADEAESEKTSTEDENWLIGEWKRYLHHHDGFLTIKEATRDGFEFELQVFGGANTNVIEGRASMDGNTAFFELDNPKCGLNFELNKNLIKVKQTDDCNSMGMNGTFFYGDYQQGPNLIEVDLAQQGFLTEAENDLFKTVVGEAYPEFLQNMMITSEETNLDNLQVRVISGFVRGLAADMTAIIMINDKYVYAAVPSDESSKTDYYTNDPSYKKEVPLTIRQWINNNFTLSGDINYK